MVAVAQLVERWIVNPEVAGSYPVGHTNIIKLEMMNANVQVTPEFRKQFLIDSDHSGRHLVKSLRSGKTYFVEPVGGGYSDWGDIDPATKKVTGSYGSKYRGSVDEKDSMITKENGFKEVHLVQGSPYSKIDELDKIYMEQNGIKN